MAFYQLAPADVMIVLDDLALPCGKLRIRAERIERRPQRPEGHRASAWNERVPAAADRHRPAAAADCREKITCSDDLRPSSERKSIPPSIVRYDAIMTWIEKGITAAMNRFNADETLTRRIPLKRDAPEITSDRVNRSNPC